MTPLITLSFKDPRILGFSIKYLGSIQPLEFSIFESSNLIIAVIDYTIYYNEMNDKMKEYFSEEIRIFLMENDEILNFNINLIQVWLNNDIVVYFKDYDDYYSTIIEINN